MKLACVLVALFPACAREAPSAPTAPAATSYDTTVAMPAIVHESDRPLSSTSSATPAPPIPSASARAVPSRLPPRDDSCTVASDCDETYRVGVGPYACCIEVGGKVAAKRWTEALEAYCTAHPVPEDDPHAPADCNTSLFTMRPTFACDDGRCAYGESGALPRP